VICSSFIILAIGIADPFLKHAPRLKSGLDWGGFLNPIWWIPGTALGLFVNRLLGRLTPRCVACWIWIVGVVWLTIGVWDSVRGYDARYYQGCSVLQNVINAFFIADSQRCGGGESTLAGLFFTTPAINSIGYAVGAWLALRFGTKRSESE
jgi:hypothetical protein